MPTPEPGRIQAGEGRVRLRLAISVAKVQWPMSARHVLLHLVPGQARARLALRGPDTQRFLQGILSADLAAEPLDEARAAALLTVKGKIISDAVVLPIAPPNAQDDDVRYDLLVPEALATDVHAQLERHIIMDDVELEAPVTGAMALVWDEADGASSPALAEGVDAFSTRYPAPGRLLWAQEVAVLDEALAALGTRVASPEAWERHRVQTATPAWGHELAPGLFPPEAGFVFSVSYNKGCYLGQEPLARIHARGQVNRVMVRVAGQHACPVPSELRHEERADAGTLTTFVPAETGGYVGLAIVRRTLASSGTILRVTQEDGSEVDVLVASDALGDDPGVGQRKRQATLRLGSGG